MMKKKSASSHFFLMGGPNTLPYTLFKSIKEVLFYYSWGMCGSIIIDGGVKSKYKHK